MQQKNEKKVKIKKSKSKIFGDKISIYFCTCTACTYMLDIILNNKLKANTRKIGAIMAAYLQLKQLPK